MDQKIIEFLDKQFDIISDDDVLREYHRIAFSDVRKILNPNGTFKHPKDFCDDIAPAIQSVEMGVGRYGVQFVKKITMWPKMTALEMLAKRHALYEQQKDERETFNVELTVRGKVE